MLEITLKIEKEIGKFHQKCKVFCTRNLIAGISHRSFTSFNFISKTKKL